VRLPLQIFLSRRRPAEVHAALRDISRSGIYFESPIPIDPGEALELTFALPTERDAASVLVRASAKALRATQIESEPRPVYGVAASIDRVDFVRPVVSHAA
jgi:hypothetical protein